MRPDVTRRDFLKISGGVGGLLAAAGLFRGPLEPLIESRIKAVTLRWGQEITTVCPFASCGCGFICYTDGDTLIRAEGDPEHPVNRGAACPKGLAMAQLRNGNKDGQVNERRLQKVLYRAPGGGQWQEKDWDFALERIAQRIKETRDSNWTIDNGHGRTVNRTEAIASVGGASLNNEECYLLAKMLRALGIVYVEHQGRHSQAAIESGLSASFGRSAMSNHWTDISNADCILIIGLNNAENHPSSFIHVNAAQDRGARLISVDPRFTRTSAKADIYCPTRPGTDIAFIGGMIKYVIDDIETNPASYNITYITEYTNAANLVSDSFKGPADLDGFFSGFNAETNRYEKSTWSYQASPSGVPRRDKTLKDPNCVFQVLKRHYARYTPERVSATTGTPVESFLDACRTFAATGAAGQAGTILAGMGSTQHSSGSQAIRSFAILQLLLGNIGVAGGGVNAISVEANGQGASDHGLLYNTLPGYLKMPLDDDSTLAQHLSRVTQRSTDPASPNLGRNYPAQLVSLLKAWYGETASRLNDFAFANLPRIDSGTDYSWLALCNALLGGQIKGLMAWGQNPAVGSPNAGVTRRALEGLQWLVVSDIFETETAAFWKRPGADPGSIQTEVFLLPAACSFEKEGSVTNAGRWMQWRYKAVNPLGEGRSDLDIISQLMSRLRSLYGADGGPNYQAITGLSWGYQSVADVAREINGSGISSGRQLEASESLKDDGTTSCGNRLYCGSFTEGGNMAARRDKDPGGFMINLYPRWGWSWPDNKRILYNRASVDLAGQPWDSRRSVIQWNSFTKEWKGDVPDGDRPPDSYPFVMLPEGRGLLFAGLDDGPLPEHYEPWESPVANQFSGTQSNPILKVWSDSYNPQGDASQYPVVATTFRVGEHWGSGQMTRNIPWLLEMTPEAYLEMSQELASSKGIQNGDMVSVRSARGQIRMRALVTRRLKPLAIAGKTVHHIALTYHWGYMGLSTGDSANILTPSVGDASSAVPEFKAFLCDVVKET